MALSFDFSPKNGPNSHSQIVKKFCDGFHVDSAIELARIIRERMAAKGYVPGDLLEMYKRRCESRNVKLKETESSLLAKFCHIAENGNVPKRLRSFIYETLDIGEKELAEALAQHELRKKMSAALGRDQAAECFLENLPLILKHKDFVMKYREFASLQFSNVGFSYCWFGGRYICLGELLNYYKYCFGVAHHGCPHCSGDVYNYWCCGSMLSGTHSISGTCISCGNKVHNAIDYRETSAGLVPAPREILMRDKRCFGAPKTTLSYILPATHVPCECVDENPWDIFSLVALLKSL